jgi:type III pantothenate kinase
MGTATTINLIDKDNKVLGGVILPGVFTQLRSLIEHTSALKKIRLEQPQKLIGSNTNEAISSGIVNGMFGTVSYFLHTIMNDFEENIPILVTGGNSGWIINQLKSKMPSVQHIPTLVLEGIVLLTKTIKQ